MSMSLMMKKMRRMKYVKTPNTTSLNAFLDVYTFQIYCRYNDKNIEFVSNVDLETIQILQK